MAEGFYRRRDDWMRAVLAHPQIPNGEKVAALHWALQYLNRKTETAWPSNAKVAESINVHPKTVQRMFSRLERYGFLHRYWQPGRKTRTARIISVNPVKMTPPSRRPGCSRATGRNHSSERSAEVVGTERSRNSATHAKRGTGFAHVSKFLARFVGDDG